MPRLALITYPIIDPIAVSLGPISIKWYGLAYAAGLLFGLLYVRKLMANRQLWSQGLAPLAQSQVDDLLLFVTCGVIIGGRLGQVLLYDPAYYWARPVEILEIWKGGMSFHGGAFGCLVAVIYFCSRTGASKKSVMDACCAASPLGLFLGRIANFINSEHWGRSTTSSLGMVFPNGGPDARHASQIYEAGLEGIVMFAILRGLTHHTNALRRPGCVAGAWMAWYACARSICELFREPEAFNALNIEPFSAGQIYSLPLLIAGLVLIVMAHLRHAQEIAPPQKLF